MIVGAAATARDQRARGSFSASALFSERLRGVDHSVKRDIIASLSLHSDTVEDLIRISVEGPSLEDVDARESVASWFSRGQRSRKLNYRSWLSEGHVTAMEDSP